MPNYFEILGVSQDAPPEVVRAAYQALARLHHPDRTGTGDSEKMAAINRAYEVLSDAQERERYVSTLKRPFHSGELQQDGISKETMDAWMDGVKSFPYAEQLRAKLEPLGIKTVATFVNEVVSEKAFHNCTAKYWSVRDKFLRDAFSNDRRLQKLGEQLMVSGENQKAASLAKRIQVLGLSPQAAEACFREFADAAEYAAYEHERANRDVSAKRRAITIMWLVALCYVVFVIFVVLERSK